MSLSSTTFSSRVSHQFAQEWRAQRGLVLLWWAALGFQCWEVVKDAPSKIPLPDWLPGILALLIVVRSVRVDAPMNADVNSHTRPLGRDAVRLAKVLFFILALLLPWTACVWPEFQGLGLGAVEWLFTMLGRALPAVILGSFVAVLVCASSSGRRNMILSGIGISVFIGQWFLESTVKLENPDVRYIWAVAACVWCVTMIGAWWRLSLARRAWPVLFTGTALILLAVYFWRWDWRARPEPVFADSKLALHFGKKPEANSQELWPGLYLTGLPADHVASVVSLSELGKKSVFSDYTITQEISGLVTQRNRWMTQEHTRALMSHYPAGSLWHGKVDLASRTPLKKIIGNEPKPWRIKLAVQRMTKLHTLPMSQRGHHKVVVDAGRRLDFHIQDLNKHSRLTFGAELRHSFPMLAPRTEQNRFTINGTRTEDNFLILLHSPSIREVRTASEGDEHYWPHDGLLERHQKRPVNFSFSHPRPQMDIAGLKLQDWLNDSTLDLWWPVECGVVELDISVEDMQRLIEMK